MLLESSLVILLVLASEVISNPLSALAQIIFCPIGGSLAGGIEHAAAFVFIGEIPTAEANIILFNQFHPLGGGVKVIAAITGSVTHTEFADKYGQSVLCTGFQTVAEVVLVGARVEMQGVKEVVVVQGG